MQPEYLSLALRGAPGGGALRAVALLVGLALVALPEPAGAQNSARLKIWDVTFGIPIASLPLDQFVDPSCGTNGGPPARVLKSFDDFAQCPPERGTGLHEVWFRYDDEMEYVARARRSELMIKQHQANSLAGQPIITSLLIGDTGLVAGYRIVTDTRAEGRTRVAAYGLSDLFKGMVGGLDMVCSDLPPAEGERPVDDVFVKQTCERTFEGRLARIEARHYYKPGQHAVDPNDNRLTENQFESSARLEVFMPPAERR
ncbi:MAG: hypothetical protein QOG83_843 [Alphaproteobacteria bacterium]|nr:hypothetical protein [Alphaproteobacteria bacterium]